MEIDFIHTKRLPQLRYRFYSTFPSSWPTPHPIISLDHSSNVFHGWQRLKSRLHLWLILQSAFLN